MAKKKVTTRGPRWPSIAHLSTRQFDLSVQEKRFKIHFQDEGCGGHLGSLIGTILAIFDLQVTPIFPTKFPAKWPSSSGEEFQKRFARLQLSWISDRNNFRYSLFISHPNTSYQVMPFGSEEELQNTRFQDDGHLEFLIGSI